MAPLASAQPLLKAPFPWYGGKTRAAPLIWQALGDVGNYVEPFAGSLAVVLGRPHAPRIETVNDLDAFLVNIFRALQADPDAVAHWCDFPVNEAQQHAIHTWLVEQRETFAARLMGDPDYYDVQVAGRWLYGICCWIGGGWCSGKGPWQSVDGQLVRVEERPKQGVSRRRVQLRNAGQGVKRQLVHLSGGPQHYGNGVHGQGAQNGGLSAWFAALQARLHHVRVCCGDWTRVLGPSVTFTHGLTGVLLDPPYATEEGRDMRLYRVDSGTVAHDVRTWCLANGDHPLLRIVLCGYGATHDALLAYGWRKAYWTTNGGYANQRKDGTNLNRYRETLWMSPQCLRGDLGHQLPLFG
jgi:hypothetical protein